MATTTTNYGMTKPDVTDYYDVNVFNGNADIVDAKLKELEDGKLDTDGDASNLALESITSSSAEYPTFSAGLLLKTVFGRIQKFLNDLKANCVTSLSVSGKTITYTKAGGGTGTITTQDTTYSAATTSKAGLMSAADKTKLDGIASGAQVNGITGVKGNSESSYRTGNVNLTAANVGAAAASHNHAASNINSGTLSVDRLPTVTVAKGGTGATTAAAARTNLGLYGMASGTAAPTTSTCPSGYVYFRYE